MKPQPRTIRLPQETWDLIEDVARSERRTTNSMVQVLLEDQLAAEYWAFPVRDGHPEPPYAVQTSDNFTGGTVRLVVEAE